MSKIEFFPLNREAINDGDVYERNPGFSEALKNIVDKDINLLNKKLDTINVEVAKILALTGTLKEEKLEYDVTKIDDFISYLETKIGDIIIEKGSIKIGLFTTNKKFKRERIQTLESSIETLHKYQDDLLMIKKEYEKIVQRKDNVDGIEFETKEDDKTVQNPLERTVNFYIKKQENSN